MIFQTLCARCGAAETMDHRLFHCNYAKEVWDLGPWSPMFIVIQDTTFASSLQASYLWKALPPYGIMGNAFPWICWYLWVSRNKDIFESRTITPHELFAQTISAMKEWKSAQPCRPPAAPKLTSSNRTVSILPETVFCNSDAAWKSESRSAGLAWIFSDQANTELTRASSA